ncbi:toll-like receptor 4 [Gigantopelta aegis]|uniref:toll-like receptor 4 n=1 Tax=Gigantopelta aegis TaxID=1735272 RepID=UPI001B88AE9D|nr:toll-like receptor 4 [Gigantopelta aegis]XP_041348170.1 toll-like receptor 4 [Gigantopelta aegis]
MYTRVPRIDAFLRVLFLVVCASSVNLNEKVCLFKGTNAICSHHGARLWYIPRIPPNITILYFNFNVLTHVTKHTFRNITGANMKLQTLHLNFDKIQYISLGAFGVFRHLSNLSLTGNHIKPVILAHAFTGISITPVQRLDMLDMGMDNIPEGFFRNLNSSKITHLHMHMNKFLFFDIAHLRFISSLVHVGLSQNYISYVVMHENDTLKELDVGYNIFRNVCSHASTVPSLVYLNLNFDSIYYIEANAFDCLPNLQHLKMNGNFLTTLTTSLFSKLPNLITLHLQHIPVLKYIDRFAFNNSNLKHIYLNNGLSASTEIHKDAFGGCSSLTYIDLSGNNFKLASPEFLEDLFKPVSGNLETLRMIECSLPRIPPAISTMKKLNFLNLGINSITNWDSGIFENLESLKELYLNQNHITKVSEASIPNKVRQRMQTIDLSSNPFYCSCSLFWFIQWFRNNQSLFNHSLGSYECAGPDKLKMVDLKMTERTCLLGFTARMLILFGCSFVTTAAVVIAIIYKYRWHLRYLLYMACMSGGNNVTNQDREYTYDAFVLYCAHDADWIFDVAVPILENRYGLKLCLHERDFEAGRLIIDNIMNCINQSRKLVVVLSNSVSESEWCHFEMDIIQRELLENRRQLPVVIMMEELNKRRITHSMSAILMSTTCIKWVHDPAASRLFWENLIHTLRR